MATALDQASQSAAAQNTDPSPPAGFRWTSWGGNWAGAVGNPLEAIYFWMYDDGLGSYNIDCTPSNSSGCWGHRHNILMSLRLPAVCHGHGLQRHRVPGRSELDRAPRRRRRGSGARLHLEHGPRRPARRGGGRGLVASPAVGIAATPDGEGYWLVAADGGVFAFGDACLLRVHGRPAPRRPHRRHRGSTPDGRGYWLVAADGGLFAFGDAGFYGSMGGHPLARKVVGLASTADGRGYWEVASDGGLFAFGDAGFYGSMGGRPLARPVVGLAPTADGRGYWEVASDGGIFAFGDAPYFGSMGGRRCSGPS